MQLFSWNLWRMEKKGEWYFKELWLIGEGHVCPPSDIFSVGKMLVLWTKRNCWLLEWKTSWSTAHRIAGKKFASQPKFHNLNYGCKSLVTIIHSLPVLARFPTSLEATPKIDLFLHSLGQYIEKSSTCVLFSSTNHGRSHLFSVDAVILGYFLLRVTPSDIFMQHCVFTPSLCF